MIVLDVETTGLDPRSGSIVSLGALVLEAPNTRFYEECCVWDGAVIEEEALAVNGFTRAQVTSSNRMTEEELVQKFVSWVKEHVEDYTLAAQNVSFDLEFVQQACARAGIACPFGKRSVDVHSLVWMHMQSRGVPLPLLRNRSALSLDAELAYCGLPKEEHPHNALTGALCHAEVLARVTYTKSIVAEFSSFPIPDWN